METLLYWDTVIFEVINSGWQNGFLDAVMPLWRNKYLWVPLYLLISSFLMINFGKNGAYLVATVLLTITISDTLSSAVLKKQIQRPRPCKQEVLQEEVHLLIPCGAGYSFPSSHATNHFALALVLITTLGKRFSTIKLPLFFWAASIALGQVYVGVHYPLDIIGGAVLGSLIGGGTGWLFNRLVDTRFLYPFSEN